MTPRTTCQLPPPLLGNFIPPQASHVDIATVLNPAGASLVRSPADATTFLGVLSQWPPSPSKCYDDIKAVGNIFCTITGQQGFMNFLWPVHPKVLVILCIDVYLNLSIPFNVTDEEIVVSDLPIIFFHARGWFPRGVRVGQLSCQNRKQSVAFTLYYAEHEISVYC
uniref:Putative salivary secreted protein n=1 Tax=Ixodes ricinus TaxID=34613 RepID=A0A6B0UY99_IXORI